MSDRRDKGVRELTYIEKNIIRTARNFEMGTQSDWGAVNILFRGWPEIKEFRCKQLGISAAIQNLIRLGLVKRTGYGRYLLTDSENRK